MSVPAVRFRELKYYRPWWFVLIILLASGLAWWAAVTQLVMGEPWGNNPASDEFVLVFFIGFGILFPLIMFNMHLTITVSDAVYIKLWPFMPRARMLSPRDIDSYQAMDYDPLSDYGGWGIKGTASDRAYNVSERRGVKFNLRDGRKVMIGSQRAEQLKMSVDLISRPKKT
ncbi:MAG: DUF6141 family protein [Methanomassiliicoccales archaeon]|nr:DUF6141 family protein [Methanomassiliicoccales archaeon]